MGLIQDAIRKLQNKREAKEDFETGQRIQENFQQKKMNANERELLRYKEEERQKQIKDELEYYRKTKNDAFWSGRMNNPVMAQNVTVGQKEIFKNNENIFAHKSDLFNQPSLFMRKG